MQNRRKFDYLINIEGKKKNQTVGIKLYTGGLVFF